MNPLSREMKEELAQQAIRLVLSILTLTFDSYVITVKRNLCCCLLIKGNHYAKYDHPRTNNKRGFHGMGHNAEFEYI